MNQEEVTGEIVLIRLSEWQTHESFNERLEAMIASGLIRIVIDLHSVALVNSTLLGLFVKTRNAVKARGGDFVLVDPSEFVHRTLKGLGLTQLLVIAADIGGAVRHFWPPES